jgi:precorrin-2/cobalt-factor-2 C20-methyltransferase
VPYVVPYVLSYGAPVRKTSVYLPDALKRRLAAAAEAAHRSEADLVREAIEQRVAAAGTVARGEAADPPVPGRLVGVGVGPGAADLLTVRALRALRRATVVVAPCTDAAAVGRAEAIVREAAPDVVVERLVFVMAPSPDERASALDAAATRVLELLDAGEEVAFITLGDPNVYSTFSSIAASVRAARPDASVETVPGVMAFQDLASRAHLVLTDEQQSLVLLPANGGDRALDDALDDAARTIVLYKGGRRLPDLAKRLDDRDRLDDAMLGELLGMPGERIAPVADVADRPASYLSAVIVPAKEGA